MDGGTTWNLAAPLAWTLFVWWFSTGLILYLDGLPRRTFPWTMAGATVVLGLALWGLASTADDTTVAGAYCAFTCALLVWAWQEVAFLLGYITGPRRTPCPPDLPGSRRVWLALQTVIHHELALVALALAVLAATAGGSNLTGWWTFLILWTMRQSAKLNVFLGVRNLSESFLPPHLRYLGSYFSRRRMNPLLPVSVLVAGAFAWPLWVAALTPQAGAFEVASATLLAVILTLAILEHVFLVMPLSLEGLWRWGLRSHEAAVALSPPAGGASPAAPPAAQGRPV